MTPLQSAVRATVKTYCVTISESWLRKHSPNQYCTCHVRSVTLPVRTFRQTVCTGMKDKETHLKRQDPLAMLLHERARCRKLPSLADLGVPNDNAHIWKIHQRHHQLVLGTKALYVGHPRKRLNAPRGTGRAGATLSAVPLAACNDDRAGVALSTAARSKPS